MDKNTFLSELSRKLRGIPKADYDDAMNYYVEYFMDADVGENDDVIGLVGTPEENAARIMEECTDKQFTKAEKEGGVKNSSRALWYIILGLFAAPIAFPIAVAIAAVIFAILVAVVAVIGALILASGAIVIAGVAAIPAIFWAETGSQALILIGIACVGIAFGALMCIAFYKLGELVVKMILKFLRSLGRKKSGKSRKNSRSQSIYRDFEKSQTSSYERRTYNK